MLEAGALAEVHDLGSAGGLPGLGVGEGEGDDVVLLRDGEALSGEATVSVGGEVGHVAGLRGEGDAVAGVTESVVLANNLPDEISGHFFLWCVFCVCVWKWCFFLFCFTERKIYFFLIYSISFFLICFFSMCEKKVREKSPI